MQTVWNRINTALLVLVLLVLAGALVKGVYGGPMDPSAPPGPTLPQVEPRIPISQPAPGSFPIVISQPGSYFLTQNITGEASKDGIQITTSAVTLDLNGFTVAGVAGSLKGVHVTCSATCYLIQIRGGNVVSWGGDGIDMGLANTGQITGVQVLGNSARGIAATGSNNVVDDCIVGGNGGNGVDFGSSPVVVRNSLVGSNTGHGIVAGLSTIEGSDFSNNGGHGISVSGGIITRNNASYNGQDGILAGDSMVEANTVYWNGGHGISVSSGHVVGNHASNNGLDGILVTVGHSLTTDNNAGGNHGKGFEILGSANTVTRNTAGDNGAPDHLNYAIAGADVGPIGPAATSTSAWANISDYSY